MKQRNESPTLHSLIAFDATVKHGSMTLAAEELGISQPLVSQRIRALEEVLGGVLINRENKPTTPTLEGTKYHNEIERSLATILRATDRARHDFNDFRTKISISAYFGFAFHWLMPRLQRLQQAFPDYLFEIQPTNSLSDLIASQADIVFHYSSVAGKYEFEHMMIEEEVFPVCSPALANKLGLKAGQQLSDLNGLPLLHKDVDDPRWPNWKSWSKGVNIKPPTNPIGFRYNNFPLIVEAAVAGQGLCLGWKGLITSFIEDGKLIPLGPVLKSPDRGYTLCSNYHSTYAIGNVIKWLVNEV
ncbi:LysR substrate-binding domain-containing protein [Alteromonas halophila]|uniref:LysR family transcriptional regulator n=1 Tax=Alteromonas halophila TaxID=516698 RepID=A0A918MW40_9ALTE|nr:LysR substrate-binding domain-containing protein [Alteromonas halophila]GGW77762.1 LysR family transcriptional regulator [Alteromonas halophila]